MGTGELERFFGNSGRGHGKGASVICLGAALRVFGAGSGHPAFADRPCRDD